MFKYLIVNRRLRNAARFFYWIKSVKKDNNLFLPEELPDSSYFTKYERRECLAVLLAEKWVTQRKDGVYCLQGRNFFHVLLKISKSARYVTIPAESLSSKVAWTDFVAAGALTNVARSLKHSTKKKDRLRHTACQNLACSGSESPAVDQVPVSISCMRDSLKIGKATASRIRARAARTGLLAVALQFSLITGVAGAGLVMEPMEFRMYAETCDNPGAMRLYNGLVYEQYPSMVTPMFTRRVKI